jgi:hypothetical protein
MSLSSLVSVSASYTRSVNIERDSQSGSSSLNYIPTSRALRTLSTLTNRFGASDQPRAWSLVGPYGSGKSSFALFLSQLLSDPKSEKSVAARQLLAKYEPDLVEAVNEQTKGTDGYLEVLISGTPERLSMRYLAGLQEAMTNYWQGRKGKKPLVIASLNNFLKAGEVSISELLDLTKDCQATLSKVGCPGIMIVFDEFGKFLEFESRSLGVNDVFLLQALAEQAHAHHPTQIMVFVLLHQSIEQYARGVGESLKNEWAKIQGRFEEIPFLESSEQTLRVVKAAISHKDFANELKQNISKDLQAIISVLSQEGVLPPSLHKDEALELFMGLYPLHPLSAMILPQLCQLISQNERTLFSYLGSREQSGFKDMLSKLQSLGEFIRPDHIFDYFLNNQASVNGDYLTQRRWAESVSVIERINDVTTDELALLKTVGLINLLGSRGNIRASEAVLSSVFNQKTSAGLQALKTHSAIVHRKFNNEYRVWQGSDFDLEGAVQDQLNQLGAYSLAEKVTENQALAPVVARKYSIEKGTLRYFALKFVDALNFKSAAKQKIPQIFVFLSSGQDDKDKFLSEAQEYLSELGIVAFHDGGSALKGLVSERLALEVIERGTKALSEDPVAKKEFETRLSAVKQAELIQVTQILSNPQSSDWSFKGRKLEISNRRSFQVCLSQVLDEIYPEAPVIFNELINRDKPSSQAAGARNKLMSLLLTNVNEPDLGIQKFPPEKAIYRSVLRETQIHIQQGKQWALAKPPEGSSLLPSWERVEEFFASTDNEAKAFSEINAELIAPPYGIKAGLLPILWLSVYLVNEHELALYEERKYIPGFSQEIVERFVKRPDLFSIQRFKIDGLNASIFKEYCKVVSGGAKPKTILDVAKPLASFMGALPEYTLKTKNGLSAEALAVRAAFNISKSPERLIFEGLPKALGFKDIANDAKSLEGFSEKLTEILRELNRAHENLVQDMKCRFAETIGLDPEITLEKLREQSCGRCNGLENYTLDAQGVRGLLVRIFREESNDELWFENILMFLGSKPSKKWTDTDHDEAGYKLTQLGRRLTDLFKLAAEERRFAEKTDGDFDVYLLKSLKKGSDFIDEIVTVDKAREKHSKAIKESLEDVLSQSKDPELQLIALAQVVDDFLQNKRDQERTDQSAENPKSAVEKGKLA